MGLVVVFRPVVFVLLAVLCLSYPPPVVAVEEAVEATEVQEVQETQEWFGFGECGKVPFAKLPTAFGVDTCVGNNIGELLKIAASATFHKCSPFKVKDLAKSQPLLKIVDMVKQMLAEPAKISAVFYRHLVAMDDAQTDAFCTDFNNLVAPCAEALLPKLLEMVQKDTKCCPQFGDLVDMLNVIVPPQQTKEAFFLNEVVNGVNRFFCSRRSDTQQTCGRVMAAQLTQKYTEANFRIMDSFILPFFTMPADQTCDAVQGKPFTNTATLMSSQTIDFGACVHAMRPLFTSVSNGLEYAMALRPVDFFNGIVKLKNGKDAKFVDSMAQTAQCTFATSVVDPAFLIKPYGGGSPVPPPNQKNTNAISQVNCNKVQKCDAKGEVCSEICEKHSASLPNTWLAQTLAYQRTLAMTQVPLCYIQVPATHNSAITLADGFGNRDQLVNRQLSMQKSYSFFKTNNQALSMADQLNVGVRFLELDTHFFLDDLYAAHCGGFGSNVVSVVFETIKEQFAQHGYGDMLWTPDLLGCFPSLSGIRANEQPKLKDSFQEIKTWMSKPENANEFVMLYLDTGSEIEKLQKWPAVNQLLKDVFGELIVPQSTLQPIEAQKWQTNATVQELFLKQGHRLLVLADAQDTGDVAYCFHRFCNGYQALDTKFVNAYPAKDSNTIDGKRIYSTDYLLRSYQSALRYVSVDEGGHFSNQLPILWDQTNVPKYVRWNMNLLAVDMVDGAKMQGFAWSWAENEPSAAAKDAQQSYSAFFTVTGRWITSTTLPKKNKACWHGHQTLKWSIVDCAAECPAGSVATYPQDPYQNFLLQVEMMARGITDPIAIPAPLA